MAVPVLQIMLESSVFVSGEPRSKEIWFSSTPKQQLGIFDLALKGAQSVIRTYVAAGGNLSDTITY